MKGKTGPVIQFAIAGKFTAALFFRPGLAGSQQFSGAAPITKGFLNEDSFQISYGAGLRSFHIIISQLTLGKAHSCLFFRQKQRSIVIR